MKNKKIAVALATILVATAGIAGCNKKVQDGENVLEIYHSVGGNGTKWVDEMIAVFKAEHPDVEVVYNYDYGVELCQKKVLAGPQGNTADLLLSSQDWYSVVMQGNKAVAGYDCALEDLTSLVFEESADGRIKDNVKSEHLDACAMEVKTSNGDYEDRYYFLPALVQYRGITYNKGLFDANPDWKIPRTTDELIALCDKIKAKGIIPLVNDVKTPYMETLALALFAQYLGAEEYEHYMAPVSEDDFVYYTPTGNSRASLYSMYVMNQLQNPTYERLSKTATEDDYGRAQGRLISGEGAMEIIGSWFDNEMALTIEQAHAAGNNYQSGMMAIPVISALSDQLSYWEKIMPKNTDYQSNYAGTESANLGVCDELLSKLVEYVDNGKTGELPSIVFGNETITTTQSDVEIVEAARKVFYSSVGSNVLIPSYAKGKGLAKEFIKLMYSKRGADIIVEKTKGSLLPMNYDVTQFNSWANLSNYVQTSHLLFQKSRPVMDIYTYNWRIAVPIPSLKFYQYSITDSNYESPEEIFQKNAWSKSTFLQMMKSAGLL